MNEGRSPGATEEGTAYQETQPGEEGTGEGHSGLSGIFGTSTLRGATAATGTATGGTSGTTSSWSETSS